jgi:transcriptional regulator with XRE-family HTH domain
VPEVRVVPRRLDGKLGEQIKRTRRQRGLTDESLAVRAGLSRRQLRMIQEGANTTVLRVIGLAHALGLTEVNLGGGVVARIEPSMSNIDLKLALRDLDAIERRVRSARHALSQPATHDRSSD